MPNGRSKQKRVARGHTSYTLRLRGNCRALEEPARSLWDHRRNDAHPADHRDHQLATTPTAAMNPLPSRPAIPKPLSMSLPQIVISNEERNLVRSMVKTERLPRTTRMQGEQKNPPDTGGFFIS